MIVIVEHINLINNYTYNNKFVSTYHWIYNMYKYLLTYDEFKQVEKNDMIKYSNNIDKFMLDKFNEIPKYIIFFNKFNVINILNNCSSKIITIIDDIHHSKRIKQVQINAFNKCTFILATYYYIFFNYFNYIPNKLISFPHSSAYEISFNNNPINKILLVGHINESIYPNRSKFYKYAINNELIDIIKPPQYVQDNDNGYIGYKFVKLINNYLCTFCDDSNRKYILAKFFEITAYGSLLLACNESTKIEFEKLGFIDNVHYISCNSTNWNDKIKFILDEMNKPKINEIRYNGYLLATSKHMYKNRGDMIINLLL